MGSVLLALSGVGCAGDVNAAELPDASAEPMALADVPFNPASVVHVHAIGGRPFDTCSGVVIAFERVATAAHCLTSDNLEVDGMPALVIDSDAFLDIALLDVAGLDRPLVPVAPELPDRAAEVFVAGYGCTGELEVRAGAFSGVVAPPQNQIGKIEIRAVSCHGDSGGAIVDVEGRLLGTVSTSNDFRHWTWGAPATALSFMLD